MKKRVYGVLGIVSRMSNWNADFTGYPKTTSTGDIFGSDKAFKYPMKKMWEQQDEKVLYIKSMKLNQKKNKGIDFTPRSLKERYEFLFDIEDLKKETDNEEVLKNLFNCIDVKSFGATFTPSKADKNISITGAVQIGQGFNKYDESYAQEQQILSPFRDSSKDTTKEEAKNCTIGNKIVSDEAHYFYPFTINPAAYDEFIELGVTDGYTEEDYAKFKKASMVAATSFSTNAKIGCENEFALFVETEKDLYLPDLSQHIGFEKGEEKSTISINCNELLNHFGKEILNIEIYYNPYTTVIVHDIERAKRYNIFTQKEV